MKLKPISPRTQTIILLPVLIPSIIVFAFAFMVGYPWYKFTLWNNARQKAKGWHSWCAWLPVKMDGFHYGRSTTYAWLEVVDRMMLGYEWVYRYPGEPDV